MVPDWLQYLCDPIDGSPLSLLESTVADGRVVAGTLVSSAGRTYPIRDGIPVLLDPSTQSTRSVASFAYEWQQFGFLFARDGWVRDIVEPLIGGPNTFRDKTVLDAGAGSGAQSRWIAEAGADLVLSLELSDSIFTRHRETIAPFRDRIFAINGDLAAPPLCAPVDLVYCVNVLPFTRDQRIAFRRLARLVKDDGLFVCNFYHGDNPRSVALMAGIRRVVRLLPFGAWRAFAWVLTAIAAPLRRVPRLRTLVNAAVPPSHSFRETWLDLYDLYGAHEFQAYLSRAEQRALIDEAGLVIIREGRFGYATRPR
jgi:uncharacterized protein YbaR (Trm112 family)